MERGGGVMMQAAVVVTLVVSVLLLKEVTALGVLSSSCTTDAACGPGLYCFSCEGGAPVCTASQATPLSSFAKTYSLPFNKYAWITTHNAYAIQGEPSVLGSTILSPTNQEDTITSQLNRGVRGLMLDIYEFLGDLWLCHSTGTCFDFTAFRPLNATLVEISSFLATNPNEVITIFIEDYVTTPNALTNHFIATGLMKYMFPVAKMPKDGSDWPTVASMIASNQRFVVFTSDKKKEISEGIAYQWNYVVENQYGTLAETCANRAESAVLTDKTKSLILENYFPDMPNSTEACVINSANLAKATTVCYAAAGNRWSNFLAVDFYKRSNAGGVFSAVNTLNGQLHCGCNDIRQCLKSAVMLSCPPNGEPVQLRCNGRKILSFSMVLALRRRVPYPSATPGQTSCSVKAQTQTQSQPTVQSAAAGSQSSAFTPSPAPDSSSYYVSASKFILCLPFLISLISFGIVHA